MKFVQIKNNLAFVDFRLPIYLFAALMVALITGCASITGTTNQTVSVQTKEATGAEVSGASCELTNSKGKWFVMTPGSIGIHRSNDDMQVLCRKDGYEPGRNAIVSETKGMMFGNIIFGGGIGAIVDHNSGAAYEYPAFFQVLMSRLASANLAPLPVAPAPSVQSTLGQSPPILEDRLRELKRLFDQGLISQDNYNQQQRSLLQR